MKNKNFDFQYRFSLENYMKSILILLFTGSMILAKAQTWEVPPDKIAEVCPVQFDEDFVKAGSVLYSKHCLSCHGQPGKNAPAKLNPLPVDPASAPFVQQTDGSLFYKITTGRGLMPKFESVLKETERWQIIAYIRTFHPGYVQPEPILLAEDGKRKLFLRLMPAEQNMLQASAYTTEQGDTVPVSNVRLLLLLKRYFGNMQIGDAMTNEKGDAFFKISPDLRADTAGNITFIIRPENTEIYGDAETEATIQAGIKNTAAPLNEERALWNVFRKAPLWIILTYAFGVIGAWSVIGYIVLRLVGIKRQNNSEQSIK